jgi:hypothetical protein
MPLYTWADGYPDVETEKKKKFCDWSLQVADIENVMASFCHMCQYNCPPLPLFPPNSMLVVIKQTATVKCTFSLTWVLVIGYITTQSVPLWTPHVE